MGKFHKILIIPHDFPENGSWLPIRGLVSALLLFSLSGVVHCGPMLEEDFLPQKKKPQLKPLASLSVDELHAYIDEMKSEIARTEEEIRKKKASADAASLFFKK